MPDSANLPVELLLEIFSTLSLDGLLASAKASRQLNSLCLPLFFARHGITSPTVYFEYKTYTKYTPKSKEAITWRNDALAGLAIAFDVKSIEGFTCNLNDRNRLPPSEGNVKRYWKLIWTLRRLVHVGKFTFRSTTWDAYEIYTMKGDLAFERKQVITEIFNLCVEKGCKAFHIDRSTIFPEPSLAYPRYSLARVLRTGKNVLLMRGPGPNLGHHRAITPYRPFGKDRHVDFIPLLGTAQKAAQLQHLLISSTFALYTPCSFWTYSILHSPTLNSLTLSGVGLLHEYWETAFSWLIHPLKSKLTELSIIDCMNLPSTSLIKFITHLECLTHLRLILPVTLVQHHSPLKEKRRAILPKLTSLSAHPDWINLLCASIPRPALASLEIVPRGRFSFGTPFRTLSHDTLSGILASSGTPLRPLRPTNSGQPEDSESRIQVTLNIGSRIYTDEEFLEDIGRYHSPRDRQLLGPSICDHISHLVIRLPAFRDNNINVICEFLGWWKSLRSVTFKSHFISKSEKKWAPIWTEEKIEKFLEVATKHCPSVSRVIFNYRTYHIGAVASEKDYSCII